MIKAPCKECTERHVGCHATCEGYQAFVKECERVREERRKRNEEIHFQKQSIRKNKKKGGQR